MSTFHLQIVTPDGGFFDGEAEKLIVRAIDGDVCILARHSPYVTALGTGEARVTIDGKRRRAASAGRRAGREGRQWATCGQPL